MVRSNEPSTFLTLDGMRGFGALLVVIGHTLVFWGGLDLPTAAVCVDLFFMLSGFVIAYAYEPKIAAGMKLGDFLTQRIVRLYPLYLLGLIMGACVLFLALIGGSENTAEGLTLSFIPQFFMLPGIPRGEGGYLYGFNIPAWSLFFELWTNLLYFLLFPILTNRVLIMLALMFAAMLALCVGTFGSINTGASWYDLAAGFARSGFGFFAGVIVYRFAGRPRRPPTWRSNWSYFLVAVPFILGVIPNVQGASVFVELGVVCFIGPILIHYGQAIQPPKHAAGTFAALGGASYAIYMIHFPVYEFIQRVSWRFPVLEREWTPWSGVVVLIAIVAMGFAAERWFDRPVRGWMNAKLKARAKRRAAAQAALEPADARGDTQRPARPAIRAGN